MERYLKGSSLRLIMILDTQFSFSRFLPSAWRAHTNAIRGDHYILSSYHSFFRDLSYNTFSGVLHSLVQLVEAVLKDRLSQLSEISFLRMLKDFGGTLFNLSRRRSRA